MKGDARSASIAAASILAKVCRDRLMEELERVAGRKAARGSAAQEQDPDAALLGLQKSAGFLRTQLSKRMLLRSVPQLHFNYDSSIDRGMHLSSLIDQALSDKKTDD